MWSVLYFFLLERFYRRFPDARSVSGGLEPGTEPI